MASFSSTSFSTTAFSPSAFDLAGADVKVSWICFDAAAQPAVTTETSGVERSVWQPCAAGTRVELVRLPGVGHNWPNRATYQGLDELLAFFGI